MHLPELTYGSSIFQNGSLLAEPAVMVSELSYEGVDWGGSSVISSDSISFLSCWNPQWTPRAGRTKHSEFALVPNRMSSQTIVYCYVHFVHAAVLTCVCSTMYGPRFLFVHVWNALSYFSVMSR